MSHKIVIVKDLEYNALFENETIYIKQDPMLGHEMIKTILMHEATHILCRYEEKYYEFMAAYSNYFNAQDIASVWCQSKEVTINQLLSYYTNNSIFSKLITKDNYYTFSIVITSLLALKQCRKQKEGLLWK